MHKLYQILKELRNPDSGCPWDIKQTLISLKPALLEECYEVLHAIDNNDVDNLKEEFGDIFLVIGLMTVICEEQGDFTLQDVLEEVQTKIVRRHPHVFGDLQAHNIDDVKKIWQEEKNKEKAQSDKKNNDDDCFQDHLQAATDPLFLTKEIIKTMTKLNFTWDETEQIYTKIKEELDEVKQAPNKELQEEEIGDLLFSVINLAYEMDIDPSLALIKTNEKIKSRFNASFKAAGYFHAPSPSSSSKQYDKVLLNKHWNQIKKEKK